MIKLRPGSVPWLLRHEVRLHWREMRKHSGSQVMLIILLVFLHVMAIPLALAMRSGKLFAAPASWLTGALIFGLLTMISRTLVLAVQALHARGDMDLMLSSPLSPKSIVAVRMSSIAVSATLEVALFTLPFVNVFILFGLFGWFRAYALLPALGLLAGTLSVWMALRFSQLLGPRRTRLVVQILSAIIGVLFVLAVQLPNLLSSKRSGSEALRTATRGIVASMQEILRAPGEWLLSGPLPSLLTFAACLGLAVFAARMLGDRFVAASVATAGVATPKPTRNVKQKAFRKHAGAIIVSKELRLIGRDPWLITQVLQQTIFVLPIGIVLWGRSADGVSLVWMMVIMVAGITASALTWLSVNAEDAPELIKSAPIEPTSVIRYKLFAVWMLIAPVIVLPILVLWRHHLWFSFCIALCAAGAMLTSSLIYAFDSRTGHRKDFRTRHRSGGAARSISVMLLIFLWYGVCGLLIWMDPFGG